MIEFDKELEQRLENTRLVRDELLGDKEDILKQVAPLTKMYDDETNRDSNSPALEGSLHTLFHRIAYFRRRLAKVDYHLDRCEQDIEVVKGALKALMGSFGQRKRPDQRKRNPK